MATVGIRTVVGILGNRISFQNFFLGEFILSWRVYSLCNFFFFEQGTSYHFASFSHHGKLVHPFLLFVTCKIRRLCIKWTFSMYILEYSTLLCLLLILMKGLCLTNRITEGFKLLQVMKSGVVKPNTVIYNTLLHALCKNGKVIACLNQT